MLLASISDKTLKLLVGNADTTIKVDAESLTYGVYLPDASLSTMSMPPFLTTPMTALYEPRSTPTDCCKLPFGRGEAYRWLSWSLVLVT